MHGRFARRRLGELTEEAERILRMTAGRKVEPRLGRLLIDNHFVWVERVGGCVRLYNRAEYRRWIGHASVAGPGDLLRPVGGQTGVCPL